jgi:hypothetical protein
VGSAKSLELRLKAGMALALLRSVNKCAKEEDAGSENLSVHDIITCICI